MMKLAEWSGKLMEIKVLAAIKNTFSVIVPIYILGGLAIMINHVVLPWFMEGDALATAQMWGNFVNNGTLNTMAIVVCGVLGYNLDAFEGRILSINTHGSDESAAVVKKIIIAEYPGFSHEVSFPRFVDITPAGVSKGTGVDYLREHVFARKTFLAVGDNENDIEMLNRADVGFCMGNGADALKRRVDVILPDRLHPCVREVMEWIKGPISRGSRNEPTRV